MPFDIIGAKRAGFTDTEIAQEMAGKFGFDYSGARGAGFSDQEIIGEMLSKSDAGTTSAISPQPAHTPGAIVTTPKTTGQKVKEYVKRVVAPQNMRDYAEYLSTPANKPTSLTDYALRVVPESAVKTIAGLAAAPYRTVKAITDPLLTGEGMAGVSRNLGTLATDMGVYATRPIGFGKDDQGNVNWSLENIKEGVLTDPAGMALAAAPFAKPAAGAVKSAGNAAKATGGFVARNVGPEGLYTSALKMSTGERLSIPERSARAKTGLEGGYMPTEKGYGRLMSDISDINNQIGAEIRKAGAAGKMIPVESILTRLDDIKERAMNDINPQPLLEKITEIETNLRNHPRSVNGAIPVEVAQQMKIETYRGLKKAYGEMKSTEIEARKAVARGLKEEIAALVPEISELNAKDSTLIAFEKSLSQATKRIANRDIVGIGGPAKVGAGAMADLLSGTMGMGTATGLALWALDVPQVKASLAITMYKARKAAGRVASMPKIRAEISALAAKAKEEAQFKLAEQYGKIKDRKK